MGELTPKPTVESTNSTLRQNRSFSHHAVRGQASEYQRTLASSSAKALCRAGVPVGRRAELVALRWTFGGAWLEAGRLEWSAAGAAGLAGGPVLPFGGCAGLARSTRSSSGARSKRRMIAFISSWLGASMKAKPFDSCVSGLRITLTASATRLSEVSHDLMSSAVTQTGRFPRKTVKLIRLVLALRVGN